DVVGDETTDADTLVESGDFNFTLTNSSLDAGDIHDQLTSIEVANLTGGPGANSFDVSSWTGTGSLNADGDSNTVNATKNTDCTPGDTSLGTTDGMSLTLAGIEIANLTGGAGNNAFTFTGWSGTANVVGYGGTDSVTVNGATGADNIAVNGLTVTNSTT